MLDPPKAKGVGTLPTEKVVVKFFGVPAQNGELIEIDRALTRTRVGRRL
jgi:hypothetical protein